MHIPDLVGGKLALALDPARAGELHVHAPVRRVKVVRAPTGDHAETVVLVAQPAGARADVRASIAAEALRMYPLFGVVGLRCRAEPHLVIECRGYRLRRIVGRRRVDRQPDLDAPQIADASAANELHALPELLVGAPRALLASHLHDAPRLRDHLSKHLSFGVGHRKRLLDVDVLASQQRAECHLSVLMIGQADRYGIDVGACDELVIVLVDGDRRSRPVLLREELRDLRLAALRATRVEIAHGMHFGEVGCRDAGKVMRLADAPTANVADADSVARCGRAEQPRRNEHRRGQHAHCERTLLDKFAPSDGGGELRRISHGILGEWNWLQRICAAPRLNANRAPSGDGAQSWRGQGALSGQVGIGSELVDAHWNALAPPGRRQVP